MSISLTDSAATRVRTYLEKRGHGVGLRVGVRKSGCNGWAYTIDYADSVAEGDVVFDPGALDKSRAQFDIDLASVDLASTESEAEAKGPLWFNTAKFPVAHFASTSIRSVGGDRYEIAGKLSLKGITRDCVVPVAIKSDAAGNRMAEGTFSLKRLDYKIGEGEWADTATVADDIRVRVRIVLVGSA